MKETKKQINTGQSCKKTFLQDIMLNDFFKSKSNDLELGTVDLRQR